MAENTTAYNPETGEAVRWDGQSWIPTEVTFNKEKGQLAIWNGSTWVISKDSSSVTPSAAKTPEDKKEAAAVETESKLTDTSNLIDSATAFIKKNIVDPLATAQEVEREAQKVSSKIAVNALMDMASTPIEIVDAIGTVTDSETIRAIKESGFGKSFSAKLESMRPDLTPNEQIASNVLTMITVAGLGRKAFKEGMELIIDKWGHKKAKEVAIEMNKIMGGKKTDFYTKGQKVAVKVASGTGTSVAAIQADVQTRPEDLQIVQKLIETFPDEVKHIVENVPVTDKLVELSKQLEIAETDDDKTRLLKQYGDAALLDIPLVAAVNGVILAARYGAKGLKNIGQATANTRAGKAVLDTGTKIIPKSVAKLNTDLGRIFTSRAALNDEIYGPAVIRQNDYKYFESVINEKMRELRNLQKQHGVSDADFARYFNTGKGEIDPDVKKAVDSLTKEISGNEREIARLLGMKPGEGKIGVRTQGQDFYITRQYSAALSPKDRKRLQGAISQHEKGVPIKEADLDSRIAGALRVIDPDNKMTPGEQSYVLERMLDNMTKPEGGWYRSVFEGVSNKFRGQVTEAAGKVLKSRKKIPEELRLFFGEVSDPYKGLQSTLMNQSQVLSQLRYFDDIRRIASDSSGEPLKLPGLVPILPSRREAFRVDPKAGDVRLSEIIQKSLGRFGGSTPNKVLSDPYVSEYFATMISKGLDVFDPANSGSVMRALGKISSFGQATQTILDLPAYVLNTSGMVQMLVANGHPLNLKNYVRAIKEMGTWSQQLRKSDPESLKKLAMLKRLGVIDQDVTGEMIVQNSRIFGDKQGNIASRAYSKSMEKFGRAYGQPDLYGKLVAFESEKAAQRAIHPGKNEEWINTRAAEIVKATMPTYGSAPAAFRQLSKFPLVGNYTLFPVELVRTSKNIIKYGLQDIAQGTATGNARQIATGMRRLAGLSGLAVGMEHAATRLRDHYGITDDHQRTMSILNPEWARGSTDYFMEPVYIDETGADKITPDTVKSQFPKEDWGAIKERLQFKGTYDQFIAKTVKEQKATYTPHIRTRTLNSASLNTLDYISRIAKTVTGKVLGSEIMSDAELEEAYGTLGSQVAGQFVSPKMAVQAAMNVLTGVDNRTGRPVYDSYAGVTLDEKIKNGVDELLKPVYAGGSYKFIDDFLKTTQSEELLGLGNAERASGRPMTKDDLYFWAATGGRPNTRNLTKEMGWNLYQDIQPLNESQARLQRAITEMDPQLITPEKIDEFVGVYRDSQNRSRAVMKKLARKVNVFANTPVQVIRKVKGKTQVVNERVGIARVIQAATRNFTGGLNSRIIKGLQDQVYIPDNVLTDATLQTLRRKNFTAKQIGEIMNKLGQEFSDQSKIPL